MKCIFTHCWHLTGYVPTCRVEDKREWLAFQEATMKRVVEIANEHDAHLIIAGDLFDQPRIDDEVITLFIRCMLPMLNDVIVIGGNHSLPEHREANIDRSSLGIIKAMSLNPSSKIKYITCDEFLIDGRFEHSVQLNKDITLVHTLTVDADEIPFSWRAITARELAQKYTTPWVLVGDNHNSFHAKFNGINVLSAGCLMAETVSENEYDLGVYYIDTGESIDVTTQNDTSPVYRTSNSTVKWISLNHDKTKVSRSHIKTKSTDDDALRAIVEILEKEGDGISVDYTRNLMEYIAHSSGISEGAVAIIEEIRDSKEKV